MCGDLFVPDVRTRGLQKVCGKPACRRERKRLADTRWRSANPGYRDQDKMRRWAEEYPNYWLAWRAAHPAYVERNRQQTRERVRASRLIEGILTFLTLREVFAKPKTIDSIPAVMASSGP